jgi:hypothetical protein
MWIECKWIPEPWTEPVAEICDSQSWPLQKRWLQRAKRNGIIVGVLIGIGNNEFCYGLEGPDFDFDPSINKPERLADIASIK